MEALLKDVKFGLRHLLKSPGFTIVILLTLGLGVGANTAIFSVVNAVLFRPLPYQEPERLATILHHYPSLNDLRAPVSVPGFRDYKSRIPAFDGMAVQSGWAPNLTGHGDPERLQGARATGELFTTLGVSAALGRAIQPGEDSTGRDKVVVLSHGLWLRLFGGERDAIGKTVRLNDEAYEVIGVMPAGFRDPFNRNVELWAPLAFRPDQFSDNQRTSEFLNLTARLKPGVTEDQASKEVAAFGVQLRTDYPNNYPRDWGLVMATFNERARGEIRRPLFILLGAVGFLLLIACANVANLLLARAASRLREMGIRTALGASRFQIGRQLLTESLLLSVGGGMLGVAFAYWGVRTPALVNPASLPATGGIDLDATVLLFALGVSVLTGVLFGLAPVFQLSRDDVHETLKEGGRNSSGARTGNRVRRGLVVAEVTLALTLLAGAGLLLKSFSRISRVDPGFDVRGVLTATIALPQTRYRSDTARTLFFDQILPRLAALPGVQAVGATTVMPFGGNWSTGGFTVEHYQPADGQPGPWGDIRNVSPGFFEALRIQLVRGRAFTQSDDRAAPRVAVVDEEMVRRFWPNEDPIGKRITFGPPGPSNDPRWIQVVGVVRHTMHEGLDADPRVQLYFPYMRGGPGFMALAIRTAGEPTALAGAVRAAVREIDRDLPISGVRSMEELQAQILGPRRLSATLLSIFAGLALLLAALGIYGVMAYSVTQRARELGVRLAIGAGRRDVLGLVMGQGMRLVAVGMVLGIGAAIGLTRLMQRQLFEVRPTDPVTLVSVAVVLGLVALAATLLPALRATRVDPTIVLREE